MHYSDGVVTGWTWYDNEWGYWIAERAWDSQMWWHDDESGDWVIWDGVWQQ